MGDSRNMIAGLYDLGETIGEGHYAVVKLAKHVFTGEKVAVKVIDKMKLDQSTRTQMMQEVRLMKLVQHPNVVRLYEVIDTQTKLYLVLELGDGGDMYDYIMKHEGGLGEDIARKYFRQIVTAIQYCHKLHVVHRDLKPENVVFFEKLGMVKLTDFGFSNKFNPGAKLMTSCGSLAYSAPEILLGDAYDAPAVDIWSLGVILYMLVCGAAPFQEANDSETLTMIMDCNYIVPSHISQPCQGLISSMLCRDPANRATLSQISCHEWVQSANCAPLWDMLPLVTREHLTEEEHALIIQKMVNGSIASRETIIDCLDRNEYNHVTATYFLLAERKLRAQRHDMARKVNKAATKEKRTEGVAASPVQTQADISTLSLSSNLANKRNFNRMRKISIVEEEEEEEEEDVVVREEPTMPAKGLSRHSSTSSLVDKSSSSVTAQQVPMTPQLHLDLTLAFAAQKLEESGGEPEVPTPAPFPPSSQIGTGLSRQNSLRRSGESTGASSPCSERKSTPGSPGSPTAGHTSPARFKLGHSGSGGRKLGGSRTSPQLSSAGLTALPVLNQIHEEREGEEGATSSPCQDRRQHLGAPAGAAVLRRLEQRRRLHKSRTASCSSSEASDDDSENRKKRGGRAGYPAWRDGDPDGDQNGPPGSGGGGHGQAGGGDSEGSGAAGSGGSGAGSDGGGGGSGSGGAGGGGGGGVSGRHYRLHRNSGHRVRQSYSLNRISELHEAEQSDTEEKEEPRREVVETGDGGGEKGRVETGPVRHRRQFTPQLSSESEGESEILTRYLLDSLGRGAGEDSLNSSDSEYNTEEDRRRNKVNLRQLEERLNMIQEECNRSDDEESDDERSATIDDKSDRNDQLDLLEENNNDDSASDEGEELDDNLIVNRNIEFESVFNKIDQFLDNSKLTRRNSGRSRSEGWTFSDCEEKPSVQKDRRPVTSRARPRSAPPRPGKSLYRAHSCSSLTRNGKYPPGFWNILSEKSSPITIVTSKELSSGSTKSTELTLTLSSVPPPINLLHLQSGPSRCCNLC